MEHFHLILLHIALYVTFFWTLILPFDLPHTDAYYRVLVYYRNEYMGSRKLFTDLRFLSSSIYPRNSLNPRYQKSDQEYEFSGRRKYLRVIL